MHTPTPRTAKQVGVSGPDVRHQSGGAWMCPPPSVQRYEGFLADMYHAIDEMRRWKRKWYAGRDDYVRRNPDHMQGSDEDLKKMWSRRPEAQDAAGMEQWEQRQAVAYAAAAEQEFNRLVAAGMMPMSSL